MRNRKTAFRRILALFLVMALCITMQDMTAFAAETAETELKSETIEITGAERYDGEYYAKPALRFPVNQKKLYSRGRAELSLEEYVVAALENYETIIDVSAYNISTSEGSKEFLRILNNNPQLFYVQARVSMSYSGNQIISYQPYYLAGKEEAMQMREELETAVQQVLQQVNESMDAVQKALVVHDYLAQNCEYDQEHYMAGNVPDISHTAYGALVNQMAVCDGYASAYAYIMEHKLGIPCTVVSSDQMGHAWNMIAIDGKWYHLDLTWDDPVWDCIGRVTHNYFLLSDQAISQDHYAWTQGYTADSDRYDQEFWTDVESAISYYNGAWYYSEYQSASRKVVLKKKENLFAANAETVYQTSPWQSSSGGYYTASFMYLAQANRKLYFNTSTEIMQMDADGDVQVFYEPDDLAGKQIFGFTVQGSEILYAPNDAYSSNKQSDIRRYSLGETEPSATPSQKPAEPSATPSQEPSATPSPEPSATPSPEPAQPSATPSQGVANPDYTFQGVDGTSVSTRSDSGQATVIIFGRVGSWSTQETVRSIAASQWARRSDIRVIFAECYMASSKDVQSFATTYGCDDITFCYDEGYNIYLALWEYHDLFYGYSDSVDLPVTVVIDGENRVRQCMTGYQTADTIMDKMEEFVAADPSAAPSQKPTEPSATPSQEPVKPSAVPTLEPAPSEGAANLDYTFQAVDGTSVSTRSDSGQTTVIIFGKTTCGNCQGTVRSIAASQWVRRSDIRVIFAEFNGASSRDVQSFAASYGCDDITFCYDEGDNTHLAMWKYYRLFYDSDSVISPLTVVIDGENRIRQCMTGYQTADTILDKMTAPYQKPLQPTATPSPEPVKPSAVPTLEPVKPSAVPTLEPAPSEGAANLDYTFQAVDGTSVSTRSDSGQTTVIVFGRAGCGYCQSTVKGIAASQWVHRSDIRVIFADCNQSSFQDVQSFATNYGCDDITFCYDEGNNNSRAIWAYYRLFYDSDTFTYPLTVVIDGENRIRQCMTGYQTADTILDKMTAPCQKPLHPSATPSPEPAQPTTKPGQKPTQSEIPTKNSIIQDTSGNIYQVTQSGKVNGTVAYVWTKKNQAATVNVPSKVTINNITYEVTSLSANAFRGNTKLKKVTIGKNVRSIGNSAFEGCTALKSIVIPSKVRSIGKNAFKNCKKLKSIRIKGNVLKTVGKNAFKGIHAKAKIKVPKKQLKAYKKRLKGKGQKKTVKITK